MTRRIVQFSVYFSTAVWLVNGLLCKVLGLVPRHEQIVARILGAEYATLITKVIGALEILMAIWILTRIKPRWSAAAQIAVVLAMNVMEFILAPDLLLFGRFNIVVAVLYVLFVSYTESVRRRSVEVALV